MYRYDYKLNAKKNDEFGYTIFVYSITKTIIKQTYIVEIIFYKDNIHVVQFYLKNHRHSKNRFSLLLSNKNKNTSVHFFYLMNTLVGITQDLYKLNPLASFGFIGAPTKKEKDKTLNFNNINIDGTIKNTKRFRVYLLYIKRYFDPMYFDYFSFNDSSCFLLKNKKNTSLSKETINDYLNEVIETKIRD